MNNLTLYLKEIEKNKKILKCKICNVCSEGIKTGLFSNDDFYCNSCIIKTDKEKKQGLIIRGKNGSIDDDFFFFKSTRKSTCHSCNGNIAKEVYKLFKKRSKRYFHIKCFLIQNKKSNPYLLKQLKRKGIYQQESQTNKKRKLNLINVDNIHVDIKTIENMFKIEFIRGKYSYFIYYDLSNMSVDNKIYLNFIRKNLKILMDEETRNYYIKINFKRFKCSKKEIGYDYLIEQNLILKKEIDSLKEFKIYNVLNLTKKKINFDEDGKAIFGPFKITVKSDKFIKVKLKFDAKSYLGGSLMFKIDVDNYKILNSMKRFKSVDENNYEISELKVEGQTFLKKGNHEICVEFFNKFSRKKKKI